MDEAATTRAKMQHTNKGFPIDTRLFQRFSIDAAAAIIAAMSVSPIMAVIDRGVTEAATGRTSTLQSMKSTLKEIFRHPHTFASSKPLRAMLLLYTGTYLTANSIDTVSSYMHDLPASTTTSSTTKLCAVTTVNVGLALYKDATFARTFGSVAGGRTAITKPLPPICYIPFIVRDAITLFATFNAPAMLAPSLPSNMETYMSRLTAMQLLAPAASQFVGTPLHLLGLDLYYREGRLGLRERMGVIRRLWFSASVARACRVVPAYGLGGVVNNEARAWLIGSGG